MKKCVECRIEKPINEFSKNKSKKDGYSSICKKCHSDYRKENYIKNKTKVIAQVNQYRVNNPDKYIRKKVNRYLKKSGRTIESKCFICGELVYATKKEIEDNKKLYCSIECRNKNNKSDYYRYLRDVEKRAKKINKEFTLTEEFIKNLLENKQNNKCNITNIGITIKKKSESSNIYETASLDRIDNTKGYTEDNVQWVCLGINYMKLKFSDEMLHKMLRLIKENYNY